MNQFCEGHTFEDTFKDIATFILGDILEDIATFIKEISTFILEDIATFRDIAI